MADTGTKYIPVDRLATKKTTSYTPVNRLANMPEKPKSLTQKVIGVGKELVKGIVEPVATMVARPIQLGAELLGASDESVNEFTREHFGDWIAPTPQGAQDVYKDVGRGVQTALTAGIAGGAVELYKAGKIIPSTLGILAAEGAGSGVGYSMEQGNKIISPETLKTAAIGAGLSVATPFAFKAVGRVLKGKGGKITSKVAEGADNIVNKVDDVTPKVTPDVQGQPKVIKSDIPTPKKVNVESAASIADDLEFSKIDPNLSPEETLARREFIHNNNVSMQEAVASHDVPYAVKVIKGEIVPTDAPVTAYAAYLKNIAQKLSDEGDTSLAVELSQLNKFRDIDSLAGQTLQATQIASRNNLTDQLISIQKMKEDKIPNIIKNKEARIKKITNDINSIVTNLQKNPVERSFISDLLSSITCK